MPLRDVIPSNPPPVIRFSSNGQVQLAIVIVFFYRPAALTVIRRRMAPMLPFVLHCSNKSVQRGPPQTRTDY
jgi:hypothetical protein